MASGSMNDAMLKTFDECRHRLRRGRDRRHRLSDVVAARPARHRRQVLDPVFASYYAVPIFAFYPLFIVIFGLGDGPQLLIGFLLGVVAVIVTLLNGLDRVPAVLKKTARVNRLSPCRRRFASPCPSARPIC